MQVKPCFNVQRPVKFCMNKKIIGGHVDWRAGLGIEPRFLDRPARNIVATLTELSTRNRRSK